MNNGGVYADVSIDFSGHRSDRVMYYQRCDDRELFYHLINHEDDPDIVLAAYQKLRSCLARVPEDDRMPAELPGNIDLVVDRIEARSVDSVQLQVRSLPRAIELIRQYAPTALLTGCWLQNISAAATCHTEVTTHLFSIFAGCVGNGSTTRHPGNRYRQLLQRHGIDLPPVTTRAFSEQPELLDAAFYAPVIQLALALFPRVLLPELIGFTLAYAYDVSEWSRVFSMERFSRLVGPGRSLTVSLTDGAMADRRSHAKCALRAYLLGRGADSGMEDWQRIRRGFTLYRWAESGLLARLPATLEQSLTPRDKMIALLRLKVPYAGGHHRAAAIGGKRIDDWFGAEPFDAEGFLDALAQSDFVTVKAPARSRLLTDLIGFGGPMFRIFNKAEQSIIVQWLDSLNELNQPLSRQPAAAPRSATENAYAVAPTHDQQRDFDSMNSRQRFYRLVNSDLFPAVVPVAKRTVALILRKAAVGLTKRQPPLRQFFPYTHGAFDARIADLYQREVKAYKPLESPPRLSKEVYTWGAEQLAPTVLVDGCWLQNIAGAGNNHSRLSAALFGIYADEVGNGQTRLNHPNVYRQLLRSLNIDLPPLNHSEFAAYPGFLNAAFDLPVYLLAISHFPRTFLPEIIGLNLAIELSGLGARYMTLVDELDYWGIDSTIIRLHLSIDNMAGGHAAIAGEVVRLYLDQVLACSGQAAMHQHWRRIWTGFLSLTNVSKHFGVVMLWHYGILFAVPRWYRRMTDTLVTPNARSK